MKKELPSIVYKECSPKSASGKSHKGVACLMFTHTQLSKKINFFNRNLIRNRRAALCAEASFIGEAVLSKPKIDALSLKAFCLDGC